jgi:dihydrofolate synthase/folylpolyglutamate synthase
LLRAGWKVGRYSSPHIESVTERVNILGRPVNADELARALMRVLDCHEAAKQRDTPGADATWFDVITAAVFLIFDEAHLDWAVIEVGIVGRLDSTNVVDAEVAVVTNIELEYTEVLGMAREAIAYEKVGILKPGAALATMLPKSDAAGRVLDDRANQLSCLVLRPDGAMDTISGENVALAGIVFDHLGRLGEVAPGDQRQGEAVGSWLLDRNTVDKARLPGRMEQATTAGRDATSRAIEVVFDGAHVPFNLAAVMRDLNRQPEFEGPCVAIVALASDKDAAGFLSVLSGYAESVIFTEVSTSGRSSSAKDLQAMAASAGINSEAEPDPQRAFDRAVALASKSEAWMLVTGSLYLVGTLRRRADMTFDSEVSQMSPRSSENSPC